MEVIVKILGKEVKGIPCNEITYSDIPSYGHFWCDKLKKFKTDIFKFIIDNNLN